MATEDTYELNIGPQHPSTHGVFRIKVAMNGETKEDPVFGIHIPLAVKGVPKECLFPRNTWKNPEAYDEKANELAVQFIEKFKEYESNVDSKILDASPRPVTKRGKTSGKIHELRK